MGSSAVSSTAKTVRSQEELEKELNAICAMIDEKHFAKEKIGELQIKMRKQYKLAGAASAGAAPDLAKIDRFLTVAKEEIVGFCEVFKQHENVIRQEAEIVKSIKSAGKVGVATMAREAQNRIGVAPGPGWLSEQDSYGVEPDLFSPNRTPRQNIDLIKNHKNPVVHASPFRAPDTPLLLTPFTMIPGVGNFSRGYKRLLSQARAETAYDVQSRAERLRKILDGGDPVQEKFKPYEKSEVAAALFNPVYEAGGRLQKAFNWAGRGIFSSSTPEYNPNFSKYLQRRNALVANFPHGLNPGNTAQAELIKRYQDLLEGSKFLDEASLDETSFNDLMSLFKKEIEAANAPNVEQMKVIDEKIEELRKAMFETTKDHTKDEDAMWKFRLLQAFLIASPFIGIAYMGPILGVFSSAFGAGGLAHGLSSILTPEVLGPLGYVTQFLRLDELVSLILNNVPIIKDLVGLGDSFIGSSIAQSVLTVVAIPLLAGPIIPIGIAGLYSICRLSSEIDHANTYNAKFKDHDKKLDDGIWDLIKNLKDADTLKAKTCEDAIVAAMKAAELNPSDTVALKEQLKSLMQPHLTEAEIAENKAKVRKIISESTFSGIKETKKTDLINAAVTAFDSFYKAPNFDNFVNKKFEIFRKFYEIESLVDFSARAFKDKQNGENSLHEIVGKDIWEKLIEANVVNEDEDELSPKAITAFRKFLGNPDEANKKVRAEIEQRIMLCCHFADQPDFMTMMKKVNENMLEITNNGPGKDAALKSVEEEKTFRDQEFILEVARERGIDLSSYKNCDPNPNNSKSIDLAQRKTEVGRVEKSIKAQEIAFMKESVRKQGGAMNKEEIKMNSGIPPSITKAHSARLLSNAHGASVQ